jgi:DNA segregation ATPase FtsK/SpoIIIE-like protein
MDEELVKLGDNSFIMWDYSRHAHLIVIGQTGSGKTYFCKSLLGRISLTVPDSQTYVCDFKGDSDYSFLNGCERFYRFDECAEGLSAFYERFKARQRGDDNSRNMLVLYFDEWASFLNSVSDDKKSLESAKRTLSGLLMLSRSFNCHLIVSQQRGDSTYFATARDNFSISIGMGNMSKESVAMFFSEHTHLMKPDRGRGRGYLLVEGKNLTRLVVPKINDMERLHSVVKDGVTRVCNSM